MSRKKESQFLPTVAIFCCIGLFIWIKSSITRGNVEREARPYFNQYQTMNSATYQDALFVEGFINGYRGDIGNILSASTREYGRSTTLDFALTSFSTRWQAADRNARYGRNVFLISGLILGIGVMIRHGENKSRTASSSSR